MKLQEIYDSLPNDLIELVIIGQDFAKRNPKSDETKHFKVLMEEETSGLIEVKKAVAHMINKSKTN